MRIDPSPRKMLLRDWMTATTQVLKVHNQSFTSEELANAWNDKFPGMKMKAAWVNKALYGRK